MLSDQIMMNSVVIDEVAVHQRPDIIEYLGSKAIEELRRKLPIGATVIASRIVMTACPDRLAREMRIEVRFHL